MRVAAVVVIACTLLACSEPVELRPEIEAHLEKYESLIDTYEPKFAAARRSQAELRKVSDTYSKEAKAWMSEWRQVAPKLSDEEGKAIKARINKLNQRAVRMLQGK
jgi:hypothetical protein